ncbi:hypothetical protein HCC30_23250 [Streptomyces sp. HNM0574]|nr:hypothetical protein [Streptomyces sp. HNM0574]
MAADRSYAARLTAGRNSAPGGGRYAERWTLDGPEPYVVPLPGPQPEAADSQVLPLADGRVLIARRATGHHQFALLYPTGPGTGELPLGAVPSERVTLLPPAPCGTRAYALAHDGEAPDGPRTGIWLVAGSRSGQPEQVAEVGGVCGGGAWLDREGALLALDRTSPEVRPGQHPRTLTKTVAVDLARGGEVSPLLQITDDSDDRLLTADPDSGLLLVRSDAPGEERLGWGVLGSHRPVRFPEALRPEGLRLTPLAVQPGQLLMPESCSVAFRVDGPEGVWLAVWQPAQKELRHLRAPEGWVRDAALWTEDGELRLPVATVERPCGLARLRTPAPAPARHEAAPGPHGTPPPPAPAEPDATAPPDTGAYAARPGEGAASRFGEERSDLGQHRVPGEESGPPAGMASGLYAGIAPGSSGAAALHKPVCKPVPLQQAPLTAGTG